jgi:hypothetical protein
MHKLIFVIKIKSFIGGFIMCELMLYFINNRIDFQVVAKENCFEIHIGKASDKDLLELMFLVQRVYKKDKNIIILLPSWE